MSQKSLLCDQQTYIKVTTTKTAPVVADYDDHRPGKEEALRNQTANKWNQNQTTQYCNLIDSIQYRPTYDNNNKLQKHMLYNIHIKMTHAHTHIHHKFTYTQIDIHTCMACL